MIIKKYIFYLFLAIAFLGLNGQKAAAAVGINNWGWSGGGECWSYSTDTTFTITADMLDADGHFRGGVSGFSIRGHTFMYFDDVFPVRGCYRDGFAPTGTLIFHTYSSNESKDTYTSGSYDFGALAVGSTHHITCWGFAAGDSDGSGGCGFGPDPSCSLSFSSATVAIGDSVNLNWTTIAAYSASIDKGVGNVTPVEFGSIPVTISTPGVNTYTMTANGAASSKTCTAQITVTPPSCILTASDTGVFSGGRTILNWETKGVAPTAAAAIDNGVGTVSPPSGSINTPPITSATTFTLTTVGIDGSPVSCSATVSIAVPPTGGLVPCGRMIDDTATGEIDESKPCDLCAMLYMVKKIINFMLEIALGAAILIIVISGLLYAFSAGDTGKVEKAKKAIYYVLLGLVIMFVSWIIISSILSGMGYAGIATWNQVDCVLQK